MKRFTVKDFISYNNPCFSCGNQINFEIGVFNIPSITEDIDPINTAAYYLRPTVTKHHTEIDLRITFNDTLKLCISHKTNEISTNNKNSLKKYLDEHKLFLSSTCVSCYTHIDSMKLDFNLDKNIIKAVDISFERLFVNDNENHYRVNSFYGEDQSTIVVDKINKSGIITPVVLHLPLIPKHVFKNKEHFISKIKTYITFS